ncbi:MAG TPA: dolichyl-phosphate beta-glucosyltransferase [Candidatus Dormibacteraeota bacterium]|nr:dolichyl-phosphate beta-glucosyltransferase [Candidatus Dormibacteraeota bacterium]
MLPAFSVVIPCFNEAARIGTTIRATLDYLHKNSPESELIVVNDGSTDATGRIARDVFSAAELTTRLLENFPNRGKGAAVRSGLLVARKPIALFFDADLSTPLEEMPAVIEPIANGDVDIAFGSRALDRRLIGQHQPWRREQAGRIFNLLVRLITGLPFWDTQCGFKAFRMDSCRPILKAARIDGFAFDVELLFLARRAGLQIREIPVHWNHSAGSKVRLFQDSLRMLGEIVTLRRL